MDPLKSSQALTRFASPLIQKLLQITDFSKSYVWSTQDFDGIPTFVEHNVILIGDAAHPLLTFTSQGVNAALEDARQIPMLFRKSPLSCVSLLNGQSKDFEQQRREIVLRYRDVGPLLQSQFLNSPIGNSGSVPLAN